MNAFADANRVEAASLEVLLPWLRERYPSGVVQTQRGPRASRLQQVFGDILAQRHDGRTIAIEVKSERQRKYDNFFLETWSNLPANTKDWADFDGRLGWLYTTLSDLILYHFVSDGQAFLIPTMRLKEWCFSQRNIFRFEERAQGIRDQRNKTWGRPVPIKELMLAIPEIVRHDVPVPASAAA